MKSLPGVFPDFLALTALLTSVSKRKLMVFDDEKSQHVLLFKIDSELRGSVQSFLLPVHAQSL